MTEPTVDNVADIHREVSLMLLKSTSAYAVRTPRGQKDPGYFRWDPKANDRDKSNRTIYELEQTNDNLGIHLFGSVVDVDVDSDNPQLIAALDMFLPPTQHVWGRGQRKRTHRLYEIADGIEYNSADYAFLEKIQKFEDLAVEIRGGKASNGEYTLLPGSLHPNGERYEWSDFKAAKSSPVQVGLLRLVDAVRKSVVTALIAKYWVEGMRNEMCKAVSGFLYRAVALSDEIDMPLPLTKEGAMEILQAVMEVADDDEADRSMRLKTFEHTWEKGDAGNPITGATRIRELTGDEHIVGLLYTLLANTPDLVELEALFEQYVVVKNTTSIMDLHMEPDGNYLMNVEAFRFTLAGRNIQTPTGKIPLSAIFVNSLRRTIVDKVSIDPSQGRVFEDDRGRKLANLWSGWAIPPCDEDVTDEDVEPFLTYLKHVVCSDDEGLFQWILMWVADIFQNTASKPGTALVLVGSQGAGKSMLMEKVLRPIIGAPHFMKVSTTEKLGSKFNSHMAAKIVIQGEEVINTRRKADSEALKDAVTSETRTVELKGKDSFEMDDFSRYCFTSNHEDNAVNVDNDDRRYTIAKVNQEYAYLGGRNQKKQMSFWPRIYGWLEQPGTSASPKPKPNRENLAKLHKYLISNVKIDRSIIRNAYETEIKRRTQAKSARGVDSWLMSLLECESPFAMLKENEREVGNGVVCIENRDKVRYEPTEEWPTHVEYNVVEQIFRQFAARERSEGLNAQQIVQFFKDKGMVADTDRKECRVLGKRRRVRPWPTKRAIENYLIGQGYPIFADSEDPEQPSIDGFDDDGGPDF